MSHRESRRRRREGRHLCASCRERKAKYQYKGHVRADNQHVLCFQCFRSARERMRARELAAVVVARPSPLSVFGPCPSLNARQVEHRRRMLVYLESQQVSACVQQ